MRMNLNHGLFRFGGYEDVFIEDGHLLYAQAEPFLGGPLRDRAGLYSCHTYSRVAGWGEWTGTSSGYLQTLKHADPEEAARIVKLNTHFQAYRCLPTEEREAYLEAAFAEIDAALEAARKEAA